KPKKTVAERIAEKQAERERAKQDEAASRAAQLARFEDGGDLDPKTAARLRRQRELENDMEAAGDLFSGLNIQDQELAQAIAKAQPKTKEEYEDLAKLLAERVHKHQRDGLYVLFLESVFRAVVEPLSDAQTRRLATLMTTVANEKQKQAKALATKGKKKTAAKPTL
ncbi:translation initiation factor eIF3 subunit, partial [Ramicandelaber brevisporus]